MIKTFKRTTTALLLLIGLLLPMGTVAAEDVLAPVCGPATADATLCKADDVTQSPTNNSIFGPNGVMTKAAQLVALLVGVASVIMIIVGGFQYIMASGDPTNITNAKNTVLYAIIGLVVALSAQAIISFVLVRL